MAYGVVPEGFKRKPLSVILAELQAKMIEVFGPGVIQSSQSPLGQLNGLVADLANEHWETAEDTYQSFDLYSAIGPRLDIISTFQTLERVEGETDAAFRTRISNEGSANIKLSHRINTLRNIDGVTFAWAIENSTATTNSYGMPPHSVAYAVSGGDDEEVALTLYQMSVGGIGLFGDYEVAVVADGFCKMVPFIRPIEVPIRVELVVKHIPDSCQCAPPTVGTITQFVIDAFAGECGYKNGDTVIEDRVVAETVQIGNMKVIDCMIAKVSNSIELETITSTIFERPVIISPYVSVEYADA